MEKVRNIIVSVLVDNNINYKNDFTLNTITFVELIVSLEEEMDIMLDKCLDELSQSHTLSQILETVDEVIKYN